MYTAKRVLVLASICLLLVLSACTPADSISSFDELDRLASILKAEPLERDFARLVTYQSYTTGLRNEYAEYAEFPDSELDLIPGEDIVG